MLANKLSNATPTASTSAVPAVSGTSSPSTSTSPSQAAQDRLLAEFELNPIPDLDHLAAKLGLPRKTIRDFFSKRRRALGIEGRLPHHPPPGVAARKRRSMTADSADSDYQVKLQATSPPPQSTEYTYSTSVQGENIKGSGPVGQTPESKQSQIPEQSFNSVDSTLSSIEGNDLSVDSFGRIRGYAVKCGVITKEGKPCTRSLGCRLHNMALRRAVPGRSKPFDTLLAEYLQVKKDLLSARERDLAAGSKLSRRRGPSASGSRGATGTASTSTPPASSAYPPAIPDDLRINVPARNAPIPRFAPASSSLSEVETPSDFSSAAPSPHLRAILPASFKAQLGKQDGAGGSASSALTPLTGSTSGSASTPADSSLLNAGGMKRGRGRPRGTFGIKRLRAAAAAARRAGHSSSEEASDEEEGYITGDEDYRASPSAEAAGQAQLPVRASHRAAGNMTYCEDSDESEMSSSEEESDRKDAAPSVDSPAIGIASTVPSRELPTSTIPSEPSPRPTLYPPTSASIPKPVERAKSEIQPVKITKPPLTYTTTTYHEGGHKLTHFHRTPVQNFWGEASRPADTFLEMRYGAK